MRKTIVFGLAMGLFLLTFAGVTPVVDKIQMKFWNGQYYARGILPDKSTAELKSNTDLTYSQWLAMFEKHWQDMQKPQDLPILFQNDTYAIRDPNNGTLVLEWKPDNLRLNITKRNLPELRNSTTRMNIVFLSMP